MEEHSFMVLEGDYEILLVYISSFSIRWSPTHQGNPVHLW